jgi:hypothetical protein
MMIRGHLYHNVVEETSPAHEYALAYAASNPNLVNIKASTVNNTLTTAPLTSTTAASQVSQSTTPVSKPAVTTLGASVVTVVETEEVTPASTNKYIIIGIAGILVIGLTVLVIKKLKK